MTKFKTKTMLCLMATAMFAASCTKDEVINKNVKPANSIGIDISTGKTRAAIVDLGALKASNGFGVYATATSIGLTGNYVYIDNKIYKFDGSNWAWDGGDAMWPITNNYPMDFYAYYPTGTTLTSALTAEHTIAATPATQVDILAALKTNVMSRPSSGNVNMNFKHILSKINFMVKTGNTVTVEVQSIAIKHVGNKGTFDYARQDWTVVPSMFTSDYDFMKAPLDNANKFVGATAGLSVKGSDSYLMLMPQDLSVAGRTWDQTEIGLGNQSYIEVVYRMYETSTGVNIVGYEDAANHPDYAGSGSTATGPLFVKVAYPLPTNWLMGKAYTYTIHLGTSNDSGGKLIDDNFMDEDGNDSELSVVNPDTGSDINVPDPIFNINKPIGITVTVNSWDEQPVIDIQ